MRESGTWHQIESHGRKLNYWERIKVAVSVLAGRQPIFTASVQIRSSEPECIHVDDLDVRYGRQRSASGRESGE